MKNIYIGIDPGADGGIATISEDEKIEVSVVPYSQEAMVDICFKISDQTGEVKIITCLEKVGAMPKQGVVSTFTFGKGAGFIEGVLRANYIPYQLITPPVWKKEFSLIGKDKKESIKVCKRLFPGVNLFRTPKCTKEHDGMAEALLMALYAKRKL